MTILAILKETAPHEKRVAASPDTVKRYLALGMEVRVQSGAGEASCISDSAFALAGAQLLGEIDECLAGAQILLCVNAPPSSVLALMTPLSVLAGMLSPYSGQALMEQCARQQITAFAMEQMPRVSRAQSMDVLSSQANLAGYRAVIEAVHMIGKATPMMMTAAGTVPPAKLLILGAGVAGLQAIATAKRLGAVVSAFDVRPAVKEQVQSLGAKFIEVPSEETAGAETAGGYAKEMSHDYKERQSRLVHETLKNTDIAISTALIPGKPAPVLITEAMVKDMKPGSVIIDLAAASGGNCPLTRPDEVTRINGVSIIGYTNMPSRVASDASLLYARNLYHFIATLFKDKQLAINEQDELVKGTMLTQGGAIVHPLFSQRVIL